MARPTFGAYRVAATWLALATIFLLLAVYTARLKYTVTRQQEQLLQLQSQSKPATPSNCDCLLPRPPPVVYPVLHYLNIKAENLFRTILLNRYPKPSLESMVVEVGSNDGKQALWAAQQGYKVISFEPAPAGYRRCKTLQEKAGTISGALEFRNLAISNSKGSVHFIDNGVVSRIVNSSVTGAVKVETTTLSDEIHSDIAFLKIDVEGHELAVLQGMTTLLSHYSVDFIMMEHNPTQIANHGVGGAAEVLSFLHVRGYDLYDLRLYEFEGTTVKHAVATEENKWTRPSGFDALEQFFRPPHPASKWGAWTDIFAVRRTYKTPKMVPT